MAVAEGNACACATGGRWEADMYWPGRRCGSEAVRKLEGAHGRATNRGFKFDQGGLKEKMNFFLIGNGLGKKPFSCIE